MLGVQELIVILLIVVMIFGAKRIPEIMSGLGKGIKSFKQAVDGQDEDHRTNGNSIRSNSMSPKEVKSDSHSSV
ncbi:MAG: twin-arginine translocase TatA/TatE family subunit [Syntrophaceae bacterium]|nr:twin-arginine translocase TatA/TatE family subunit [Syntrophaceae bacterium]